MSRLDMSKTEDICKCSDEWKGLAARIGCELHGFDHEFAASFVTPDRNIISIGPKLRAVLEGLPIKELVR